MHTIYLILVIALVSFSSCKKLLEVQNDESQVLAETVFASDANAISALRGVYMNMSITAFSGGGGISALAGLSADEIDNVTDDFLMVPFEKNDIEINNLLIESLWRDKYTVIYQCNDLIESVAAATKLSETVKKHITGESLFIRAYTHFSLANLFGDIPIAATADYRNNAKLKRQPVSEVYTQVIADLLVARDLLTDTYPESERGRPNRVAVNALLARVYLYQGKWELANEAATEVLTADGYELLPQLNDVFLRGSTETIWHISSVAGMNTRDADVFLFSGTIGSGTAILRESLVQSFEDGDKRTVAWIQSVMDPGGSGNLSFAYKYKAANIDPVTTEHAVMLRLAEQYLIRAEAYTELDQLTSAITDLDMIRDRAGLPLIAVTDPGISKDDLLQAIQNERRHELFTEWGHRWFDLKRTNRAVEVIGALKPTFQPRDLLYPLPLAELRRNPFLTPQNQGY